MWRLFIGASIALTIAQIAACSSAPDAPADRDVQTNTSKTETKPAESPAVPKTDEKVAPAEITPSTPKGKACADGIQASIDGAHGWFADHQPYAGDEPPSKDNKVYLIEDVSSNLDPLMKKLVELAAREPGRDKVRIGFYGDSNHVPDYASGWWRTSLGTWFGFGGHGFVAASKPWPVYAHREIDHKVKGWTSNAASTPKASRAIYGHTGIVGFGNGRGSYVEFSAGDEGAEANRRFSSITASYLCTKRGGRFSIIVDGETLKSVDTRCKKEMFRSETVTVDDKEHKVKFKVERGNVTFFGAAFENSDPGVIVDGLGCGALNLAMLADSDADVFKASLKDRNYDMVAFHTGTNMWAPNVHPKWAKVVIDRVREALGPDVPIIFLSPPDFARRRGHRRVSQDRMVACGLEKQQIAKEMKFAFWDFFNASGGLGAISKWDDKKLVSNDLVHYKQPFHQKMSNRFTWALLRQYEDYITDQDFNCRIPARDPQ